MKGALKLRPVYHYRIRGHVQLCWLALLLILVIDHAPCDSWRNIRHQLNRKPGRPTVAGLPGRIG